MRFSVERVILEKIHPCFPSESYFKIYDKKLGRYRLGMYTSEDVALPYLNKVKEKFNLG